VTNISIQKIRYKAMMKERTTSTPSSAQNQHIVKLSIFDS